MTEKIIFVYELFLSLNISDFSLLFIWKLQPPEKNHHPQKSWGPVKSSPPFFENLVGGSTPPPPRKKGGRGFHNMKCCTRRVTKVLRFGSMIKLDNILERKYLNDKLAAFYCKLIQENFIKNHKIISWER